MFVSDKARQLFAEAQTLSANEREEFITDACGADLQLREEVGSLLRASDDSVAYFSKLTGQISLSALAENDSAPRRGQMAGNWRLGECIGRGGMGSVYRAERADDEFEKQAAVKLLPVGMDNDAARSRFTRERQILARLVHDNIARLLDGGVTEDGVPFFVMDYVDGQTIDSYCSTRSLSPESKLRLMLDVCDAVQYAHQNLVVHRDLKPGNVLVDGDGKVRLLDFGVASVLEPSLNPDEITHYAHRPVTPAFASPEMLRGEPVDVTTDVYSLGVMLYLLLAHRIPISYDGLSVAESMQHASTAVPPLISELNPDTSSELAAIVSKALGKLPGERYASVDRLTADLKNYLAGRPVSAKAPTPWYRLAKFIARNRLAVTASAMAVLALASTAVFALLQSIEASKQRDLAQREQLRLRASNEFYSLMFEEMSDTPFTTVELLDRGTAMLEQQFDIESPYMGQMLYDVARNYSRLNEDSKQIELLEKAEQIAIASNDQSLHAAIACRLSATFAGRDPARSRSYVATGQTLYTATAEPSIEATLDCLRMFAREAERAGDFEGAIEHLLAARAALTAQPGSSANLAGPLLGHLAHIYFTVQDYPTSIGLLDEALELLQSSGRGNSLGYIRVASNKAVVLESMGDFGQSLGTWEDIVERIRESGYGQRGAASLLSRYGNALARHGEVEKSAAAFRESIDAAEQAGDELNIAYGNIGLARAQLASKDYRAAHASIDVAQQYGLRNKGIEPDLVRSSRILRAKVHRAEGQLQSALSGMNELLAELGYPDVDKATGLVSALIETAAILQAVGQFEQAEAMVTDTIARLGARAPGDPREHIDVARAYVHRAEIRNSMGNARAAIADLEDSVPVLVRVLGDDHREALDASALLSELEETVARREATDR